ncbi:MAG: Flp pilus assembly protein CpaB [Chloroflexaceae bacterium]
MRRGGSVVGFIIIIVIIVLIVGAVSLIFLLQQPGGGRLIAGAQPTPALPTEIPEVEIVRARVDIPANTLIADATLLDVVTIPQTEFDPGENFSRTGEIVGKLTTRPFRANEFIVRAGLTEPGLSQQVPTPEPDRPRDKVYPFIVNNLSGVADRIVPGDFVDVVATFSVPRRESYPTAQRIEEQGGVELQRSLNDFTFNSTKTIVQRVKVLAIVRPPVATDATSEPVAPPQSGSLPQVDASGQPIEPASGQASGPITAGAWTLLLALNDQEVELMEFALASNARMVLVLRGAGDEAFEPTIGATLDLLISEFGLPLPYYQPPQVVSEDVAFTPEPTRTPAPTRVP